MSNTIETRRGIQFTANGTVAAIEIPAGVRGLADAIGCDRFDVIRLDGRMDLWVDDEGLLVPTPHLNLAATLLAHALDVPAVVVGTAVLMGVDPDSGETVALSELQMAFVFTVLRTPRREVLLAAAKTVSRLILPGD